VRHQRAEDAMRAGSVQAGLLGEAAEIERSGRAGEDADQRHGAIENLDGRDRSFHKVKIYHAL
jgi:hypothetical protein